MKGKRRSFSKKFSSSFGGEASQTPTPLPTTTTTTTTTSSTPTPVTPANAGTKLQEGSELAATPDQHNNSPPTPPPVEQPRFNRMAPSNANLLPARHSERELVVGKGVVLTANVTSCDKVIVEGNFQGNIKTGTFILAEGGQMEGEVRCSDGCVGGNMKATIIASKTLLIGKSAIVTGDMVYDSLQVMDGGRLQGKLTHYASQEQQQEVEPAQEGKPVQAGKPAQAGKPIEEVKLKPVQGGKPIQEVKTVQEAGA